jgi:hypothetical protein
MGSSPTPAHGQTHVIERAPRPRGASEGPAPKSLVATAGNQAMQALLRGGWVRPKLELGGVDDPEEREADEIADKVMRMPEGACCASCAAGGSCEDETVRRKLEAAAASASRPTLPRGLEHQVRRLTAGGEMLSPSLRAFFEPRFGRDFSAVRVHADRPAGEAAQAIQARAFATGNDLVFGSGQYDPHGSEGRRLLAHELAHVAQHQHRTAAPVLQRQEAPQPAPAVPTPTPAPPIEPDAAAEMAEREGRPFDVAKGRVGQPAATVLFSNPVSPSTRDKQEFETFTISEILDRNAGDPVRHGFDSAPPATAYAALMGGDVGGAVVQQETFFFSGRLSHGKKKLRVTAPSITEWDWWAGRDHVYRVTAAPGVVSVTGMGGFVFPLGKDLMDDPARTRFLKDPTMAVPADAQSLRDIAGVPPIGPDGKPPAKSRDQVTIPENQQEAFIIGYFRSRGLEALAYNEKETDRLSEIFAATKPGSQTTEPSGTSAEAKKIIDADRAEMKIYAALLEVEAKVEAMLSFLDICEERGEFPPFYPVYVKPQKAQVTAMGEVMRARRTDVQRRKIGLLAVSPVLGQIVGLPDPKSRFEPAKRVRGYIIEELAIPQVRGASYASLDESQLVKPATPESDEAIRKQFLTKLDAVRKAIRDTRSEMLGDTDFLLGMEGLRLLVSQDLSNVAAVNAGLNAKLMDMLKSHAASEKTWREAEIVIQIGMLFIPGIGPILSATTGFAIASANMGSALRRYTASQASVNPAMALVDPRVAETQLAQSTIDLTIASVALATEAIAALKTMESAGGAKKLEGALKQLEGTEAQQVASAASKGEGVQFQRTVSGRTLKYTESGHLVVCSSPCDFLYRRYEDVLDAPSRARLTDVDTRLQAALGAGNYAEAERIFEEALQVEADLHGKFAHLLESFEGTRVGSGPAAHLLEDHGPEVTNKRLIMRVNLPGAPQLASRFTDAREMQIAIAETLAANRPRINTWLAGPPMAGTNIPGGVLHNPRLGNLGIAYRWDATLGRAVLDDRPLVNCMVILKYDGHGGFIVQSAFPFPEP